MSASGLTRRGNRPRAVGVLDQVRVPTRYRLNDLPHEVGLGHGAEHLGRTSPPAEIATVLGTPVTRCRLTRSGNSVASTQYAVMSGLSRASRFARLTALGQCGQVGVVNTYSRTGSVTRARSARLSALSSESPCEASRIASTSEAAS